MNINQKGIFSSLPLILLAGLGVVLYILATNVFNFKGGIFSQLYPKPSTKAAEVVEITTIDPNATSYGTFQSHNQKIVSNQYGIFVTYLHQTTNQDQSNESDTWRLARSTDGGATFTTIYEATSGTRAPVIETDSSGNIYLIEANFSNPSAAHFYKFSPGNNYASPTIQTTLSLGTISAKYAMEIDEARSQLYYFTLSGTFTILDFNGTIKSQYALTPQNVKNASGQIIQMEYPHLYLDENGYLYSAWTTVNYNTDPPPPGYMANYWTIHFIRSRDGGVTWEKPTGLSTGQTLTPPINPSEEGPAVKITLDDETTSPSYKNWLSTFIVKAGKVHFMYHAYSPDRQHYVRYNLATSKIDLNLYPEFKGETISLAGLDGFCATGKLLGQIYCINRAKSPYAVAVLLSDDYGSTWHDHAVAPATQNEIYALGGSPQITDDGYIIGSYTESNFSDSTSPRVVKFFRIPVLSPACLKDCNQCPPKNTCGVMTYDVCTDNLDQRGADFCKNGATAFRCYASGNLNCQSDAANSFNYSCSACNIPSPTPTSTPTPSPTPLAGSNIKIYAYGTKSAGVYPIMELRILDKWGTNVTVKSFNVTGTLSAYSYTHTSKVVASQIKVAFINDKKDWTGDRNLIVDRINVDGVDYQSEAPNTYSTGTWNYATGCAPGYKLSEQLSCNGYFAYNQKPNK